MDTKSSVLTILWVFTIYILVIYLMIMLSGCAQGEDGIRGLKGAPAPELPVITSPASLEACPTGGTTLTIGTQIINVCDGANGSIGPTGSQGDSGQDGAPGQDGSPGTPGTAVGIVNLCIGSTNYPNTFVEIGFCINNNLYAVYSQNDGFLTYVPPGNYISHGHGSTCTLTIGPNCQVSH